MKTVESHRPVVCVKNTITGELRTFRHARFRAQAGIVVLGGFDLFVTFSAHPVNVAVAVIAGLFWFLVQLVLLKIVMDY